MFKKVFTLCLASLMAISLFAADIAGRITLSFAGNNAYTLVIDGKRYPVGNNRMYVAGLRPGRHTIEVYAAQRTNRRNNRAIDAATFTVRPQYDMHITIDRNGYVHFDETRIRSRNNNDPYDRNDRNRNWDERKDHDGRYRKDGDWRNNDDRWEASRAMSEYDYNSLLQQVRKQWSANSKYNNAREAVTRNYFTTQQVSGLLQLLSSESQRLEVAKIAHRNTVDAHNYSQLYALFSRHAQLDLDRYIKSNR